MKSLLLWLFLGFSSSALAQDPHAGHHDHSHMQAPEASEQDDLRDPHEYADGYSSHSGPYLQPDMPPHMHGGDDLFWAVLFDRFEISSTKEEKPKSQWEMNSWIGSSFDKLWLKSEGEVEDEKVSESENELFWSHAISAYWDSTLGVRYDAGEFPGRAYATVGIHGLAPYWFETSANVSFGDEGRVAFNAEFEYELLFTQRLILSPRFELDLKDLGQVDDEDGVRASQASLGLRFRYEIYRRFAPYLGVEQSQYFGQRSGRLVHLDQERSRTEVLGGLKFWF